MQWFRLYDDVLDDPKVQRLSPDLFKHWVNLLCLANRAATRGRIRGCLEDLAFSLRVSIEECSRVVAELERLGLLEIPETGVLTPHGWDERQFKSDDVNARVRAHRERNVPPLKEETLHATLHVTPPEQNRTDTEQSRADSEASADAPPKPKRAVGIGDWQPTSDERDWAHGEGFTDADIDAQLLLFRDHFRGNGKPMKDWPATFRNWMRRSRTFGAPTTARASPPRNGRATAQDFIDLMHEDEHESPGHAEIVIDAAYSVSHGQALGAGGERHRQGVGHDPGRR